MVLGANFLFLGLFLVIQLLFLHGRSIFSCVRSSLGSIGSCIIYVKTKRKLIIWQLGLSLGSPLNCHIFCIMLNKTGFNSGGAIMLGWSALTPQYWIARLSSLRTSRTTCRGGGCGGSGFWSIFASSIASF